jgi:hypothetical protein
MRLQNLQSSVSFISTNRALNPLVLEIQPDPGRSDLCEQVRALEEEKHSLLLLVCELLRENEVLRTRLGNSAGIG